LIRSGVGENNAKSDHTRIGSCPPIPTAYAAAALFEQDKDIVDFKLVVKLFNPCGAATWLLTELDPDDPDIGFGLCDLGLGSPELGSVRISELEG
jgi:hypothetical protein